MELKNTTGEGRKICDGDKCFIVEIDEIFEVSDTTGAGLITQGFTVSSPDKSSIVPEAPIDVSEENIEDSMTSIDTQKKRGKY